MGNWWSAETGTSSFIQSNDCDRYLSNFPPKKKPESAPDYSKIYIKRSGELDQYYLIRGMIGDPFDQHFHNDPHHDVYIVKWIPIMNPNMEYRTDDFIPFRGGVYVNKKWVRVCYRDLVPVA